MAQGHYDSLFAKLSEHGFDSREFIRQLVERSLQELIDSGLAPTSAPFPTSAPPGAATGATASASAP